MKTPPPTTIRNPTLLDVARDAGVARTTVAEILRGKAGYNADTRKLVTAAARRLGYRPNQLGKALRRGKSMTIGIVTATLDTPVQLVKLECAEAAARAAGYLSYLVGWGEGSADSMTRCLHDLYDRRVDGVIFFDVVSPRDDVVMALRDAPMPVVYVDWAPPWSRHVVRQLRESAMQDVASHLLELGHRRVAVMTTPWSMVNPHANLGDVADVCAHAGLDVDRSERWMVDRGAAVEKSMYIVAAQEVMRRAIESGDLPTAILASTDEAAIAVIGACHDAGLRVPEDISVVGSGDHPIARVMRPTLTTLRNPHAGIGEAAFAMLHALMKNPQAEVETSAFEYELIVRDSTGPAPQR